MATLELRWLGHACFEVKCDGFTVVIDPFDDDYVRGFGSLDVSADLVLCSHQHSDHGAVWAVTPLEGNEDPFTIAGIDTFHDPQQGALRGENTIYILEAHGLKIAHLGDLGCDLTPQQIAALQGLDALMIPVGGFYTIGPAEAKAVLEQLKPKVVLPMHYKLGDLGLANVAELDEFLSLIGDHTVYPGNTITIDENTQPQVAVLQFIPNED